MTSDESIFINLNTSIKSKVKLGNGTIVEAKEKETIIVQTNQGTMFINNVLFIPIVYNKIY